MKWISRVSETSTEAKKVLCEGSEGWHHSEDGTMHWFTRLMTLPQGAERWVVVRTQAAYQRAYATLQRQVSKAQASWEQKCCHLGNRRFACEADVRATLERELKVLPLWLEVQSEVLRLQPVHQLILALLGPLYEKVYNPSG